MVSNDKHQKAFLESAKAQAELKFTYVFSCQVYGNQKKSGDIHNRSCYTNILQLMLKYDKFWYISMKVIIWSMFSNYVNVFLDIHHYRLLM